MYLSFIIKHKLTVKQETNTIDTRKEQATGPRSLTSYLFIAYFKVLFEKKRHYILPEIQNWDQTLAAEQ